MTKDEAINDVCRTRNDLLDTLNFYVSDGATIDELKSSHSNYVTACINLRDLKSPDVKKQED